MSGGRKAFGEERLPQSCTAVRNEVELNFWCLRVELRSAAEARRGEAEVDRWWGLGLDRCGPREGGASTDKGRGFHLKGRGLDRTTTWKGAYDEKGHSSRPGGGNRKAKHSGSMAPPTEGDCLPGRPLRGPGFDRQRAELSPARGGTTLRSRGGASVDGGRASADMGGASVDRGAGRLPTSCSTPIGAQRPGSKPRGAAGSWS